MLMWFTNPDGIPDPPAGKIENDISTKFFSSLAAAENSAKLLSGSKIIFEGIQNGEPESNIYWFAVKIYGASFDLHKVTLHEK